MLRYEYAKFKENPGVGTEVITPFSNPQKYSHFVPKYL